MTERERLIVRVRKLLNLSASANEHEAAAAAAKAHALLAEHNLAMDDVAEDDGKSTATTATAKTRQNLERWAHGLARAVADAFDCEYFHSTSGVTSFIGVGADAEVCSWTYGYLYRSILRMASAYMRTKTRLRATSVIRSVRASYLDGIVCVVGRRLRDQKRHAPVTSDALVPVKAEAVKAAMPDNLKEKKFQKSTFRKDDFYAGAADAHNIPLSTPVNGQAAPSLQ